ncbi:hypothetical protein CH373_02170 [Leptospira perolatii]|uniref:Uncharacterized protein n=1 Tax=Leptospira perolatii TaxID=2023191 RepID=A0A2M9ZS61_9LEPT|nr:hypothetical protein CH360_02170 [Leptospira perolatii]PJZ74865.1 hypothetical protein CH373_02170 [Leptospira perolatii]
MTLEKASIQRLAEITHKYGNFFPWIRHITANERLSSNFKVLKEQIVPKIMAGISDPICLANDINQNL